MKECPGNYASNIFVPVSAVYSQVAVNPRGWPVGCGHQGPLVPLALLLLGSHCCLVSVDPAGDPHGFRRDAWSLSGIIIYYVSDVH